MPDIDWRLSSLLHETSKKYEEYGKRIEALLDTAQKKFQRDFTGTIGAIGIGSILGGFFTAWFGIEISFSITAIILGSGLLGLAGFLRYKVASEQINTSRIMVDLERERATFAQRSTVLGQVLLYGLPEGTPLAQLQVLLGDSPTNIGDVDGSPATWKALPPPPEKDDKVDENDSSY